MKPYTLIILLLLGIFLPVAAETPEFGENILLSTDDTRWDHHVEPTMAITDDGVIHVGWKNANEHDGGGRSVAYTYMMDDVTWEAPVDMAPFWSTGSIQSDPWMHSYDGVLHYSYLEFPTGSQGQGQISYATTADHGESWNHVRATFGAGYYADKETFAIGGDGVVYLVYSDIYDMGDMSAAYVKLSRSFDGGNSFVENVTISDDLYVNIGASVVPDDQGTVHVLWTYYGWDPENAAPTPENSTILYDYSTDGGNTFGDDTDFIPEYNATWSQRHPVSNRSAKHTLSALEFDADRHRLYATWADVSANVAFPEQSWDVYLRYSDDYGATWSEILRVNEVVEKNQWNPDFELDSSGNLHLIYYDESADEGRHLKYRIFDPLTSEFSDELILTSVPSSPDFTRPGEYNSIRLDKNDCPHVVWTDARDDELDIYYTRACEHSLPTSETSENTNTPLLLGPSVFLLILIRRKIIKQGIS